MTLMSILNKTAEIILGKQILFQMAFVKKPNSKSKLPFEWIEEKTENPYTLDKYQSPDMPIPGMVIWNRIYRDYEKIPVVKINQTSTIEEVYLDLARRVVEHSAREGCGFMNGEDRYYVPKKLFKLVAGEHNYDAHELKSTFDMMGLFYKDKGAKGYHYQYTKRIDGVVKRFYVLRKGNLTEERMANITDMGEGKCRIIISGGYENNGKRDRHVETIRAKSPASAEKKAMEMEVAHRQEKKDGNQNVIFSELAEQWRKLETPKLAEVTRQKYESDLEKKITPAFGNKVLSEIKVLDIERFLQSLKADGIRRDGKNGGLSEQTIKHIYSFLHKLFECGMKWELCNKNPCHLADTPKAPKSKKRSYHPDEVRELVDALLNEADFILEKETQAQGDDKARRYKTDVLRRYEEQEI